MAIKNIYGNFFEEKNILVTGHTGFIGSWISIWLIELGANVTGYALSPLTENDNFVVTNLRNKMDSIIGDVRNYDDLKKVFKKSKPEIVFHLAAQPIVLKSYNSPKETYDINIGGTVNVFENFRKCDSSRLLINCTTDKCYENKEFLEGYKEDDRLGGYDPYSSSKACSELITSAYRRSFFSKKSILINKKVSSVRSGNVIGGGDWQEDRLIPDCMRAIMKNEDIIIRSPNAIRPWLYVLESIRGFLDLTKKMGESEENFTGAWNFGINKKFVFKVEDIINKIIHYLGRGNFQIKTQPNCNKLHETTSLLLDCTKAKNLLGWKPELDIEKVVKFTCDWYMQKNVDYDFDVKQIKAYLELIKK